MPLTFPNNPQIGQTIEYSFTHPNLGGETGDEVTRLWTWNGPTMGWVSNGTRQLDYITRAEAIDIFVNESGDTMTGTLIGTDIYLHGSLSADKGFRESGDPDFQDNEFITKSYSDLITPAGIILPYGGDTAPDGYLLCDGSSYSRTTYSRLFGAIGTKYGAADSATFKVPDFQGRVPMGVKEEGSPTFTLGETGGNYQSNFTLESKNLPPHTHQIGLGLTSSGAALLRHTAFDYVGDWDGASVRLFTGQSDQTRYSGYLNSIRLRPVAGFKPDTVYDPEGMSNVPLDIDLKQPFMTVNYIIKW